jgi:hypothetical protein
VLRVSLFELGNARLQLGELALKLLARRLGLLLLGRAERCERKRRGKGGTPGGVSNGHV